MGAGVVGAGQRVLVRGAVVFRLGGLCVAGCVGLVEGCALNILYAVVGVRPELRRGATVWRCTQNLLCEMP
jgi:hypothetical protein